MDARSPIIWQVENFDRAGKLWKMIMGFYFPLQQGDGEPGVMISHIYGIDWKAAHATVLGIPYGLVNRKGSKPEDYVASRISEALNK